MTTETRAATLVASADWHLAESASARCPEMRGDAAFGLDQIVAVCLRQAARKPTVLLAAGGL
jgi:hypothetical protein